MNPLLLGIVFGILLLLCVFYYVSANKTTSKKSFNGSNSVGGGALKETEYKPFKLLSRTAISPNTFNFRFSLGSSTAKLGLPIGKHMLLRYREDVNDPNKAPISRPYTPVTNDKELGYFELVIKIYPQGKMGPYLASLPIGDIMEVRGPLGQLEYKGKGNFVIQRKNAETGKVGPVESNVTHIGMIAGGTGITPMFQIIKSICQDSNDKTKITLIAANVTESDILLKNELDSFASSNSNLTVYYTLDKPSASWNGLTGFVTAEMIDKHLPKPNGDKHLMLLCGPKPMIEFMEKNLKSLDFNENQYFKF